MTAPEPAAVEARPAAPCSASPDMEPVRELAGSLLDLTNEAYAAAERGDAVALATLAEQLLPLHVDFARVYRTWLARRVTGGMFPLGSGDNDRQST